MPCITPQKKCLELRSPGLVFRVLQYLNSAVNIYPTAATILKLWGVLEYTSCKKAKSSYFFWSENSYNLIYPRWLDKTKLFIPIPPLFPKIVFRPQTMSLHSIVLLDFKNVENCRRDNRATKRYLSAATTVINMLLLNRNNKDLHCTEVLLLIESSFEHTKLH